MDEMNRGSGRCLLLVTVMILLLAGCGMDAPSTRGAAGIAGLDGEAMLARLEDRGGYVCGGAAPIASTLQRWMCVSEPADPSSAPRVEVIIGGESLQAVESVRVSVDLSRAAPVDGVAHNTLKYIVDATALPDDLRTAAKDFLASHVFEEGQADLPGLTMHLSGGQALRRLELVQNEFSGASPPFGK
jgi:hypothetical protein